MNFDEDIAACLAALETGGTIAYPTDTVWGLGCDACNEAAVQKIFEIKDRPAEKAMIILVADAADLENYITSVPSYLTGIISEWNMPLTIIYPGAKNLAESVISADGSIAIRIVKNDFCKELIRRFGKPIVSTSANFSGAPTAKTFEDISSILLEKVDYVVKYKREDRTAKMPSALIRLLKDGEVEVLRDPSSVGK